MERLREENARLREENRKLQAELGELEGSVAQGEVFAVPEDVRTQFAGDPLEGTLAGLRPGEPLQKARARFGREKSSREWEDAGRRVTQYEWEMEPALVLRVNVFNDARLSKIAVAFDPEKPVDLPVLLGVRLGQDRFPFLQQKFGENLTTHLQLWGARGIYTIAQRMILAGSNRQVEFIYQMPDGLSRAELDLVAEEVERRKNPLALEPYLRDRPPFQIGLEAVR